ncbi:DMT family transporter [Tritonibacter horizontis]|uniref:EamA-like transporter family protein n=1 Tax=Tritonibacter horizontis TaxID=1768241 RepID=A0A132C028_9RHOB|nr:DMT family transporter [Tritonibacter horizontis]KUP93876.1 EamA-like transporter family protein [Tritonibacter horizontis]
MRLIFLTILVMIAFAANSILGRWAIGGGHMDATGFGVVRLASGAAMLAFLCVLQGGRPTEGRRRSLAGGAALTLYIVGFSVAYVALDAGLGALVLFGVVQVSMFGWGIVCRHPVAPLQIAGAAAALLGLGYVVWPGGQVEAPLWAVFCMGAGGLGWGIYSLIGRGAQAPVAASAVNFALATVMILPAVWWFGGGNVIQPFGVVLAMVSGALTSGLGYALWYRVLPQISGPVAATVQLSVPVIAILAGALLLGEAIGGRLIFGSAIVLGGIALVIFCPPQASSGS